MIRKTLFLLLMLLASTVNYGQTTLSPGDIAITGFNATDDNNYVFGTWPNQTSTNTENEFTFVLLTDVEAGTTINFTDKGWKTDDTFRTGEGTLTWTASSYQPCGTEITINTGVVINYRYIFFETGRTEFYNVSPFSSGTLDTTNFANFELGTSGDQILAYQGTEASPSFVFGLNFSDPTDYFQQWYTDAIDAETSALPTGLTNTTNAIAIRERDNGNYNCTATVGTALILEAICTASYWNTENTRFEPLGGCIYTCGDCGDTVTWTGGVWDNTWGPDDTDAVVIADNYNTSSGNIHACSLTINSGVTVTVDNNTYLEIEHDVIVDGNLIIETQGNFIQRGEGSDAGTFTGTATVNKTTPEKTKWYHFTYWSSPVVDETIANVFPLVDGDRRYSFTAANFVDNDPIDDEDDDGNDWQHASGSTVMTPGKGYAVAGERVNLGAYPRQDDITFSGVLNTGDIDVTIRYNVLNTGGIRWNFIGNPYPSAISFLKFYNANSSVIEGAVYYWSHSAAPSASNAGNQQLNFSQDDYAVKNVSGSTAGGSNVTPNDYIPSGQGFFVPALSSLGSPSGLNVTFTNDMREINTSSNSQFFKSASTKKSTAANTVANKLWINLTSNNGVFNQALIAYIDGATDSKDAMAYDAPKLINPGFAAVLYTNIINDGGKYTIQGKAINSINEDEVIQLGFSTSITVDTEYKLSIDHLQGDFLNSNTIYIKDNALDTIHNLTDSDYSFTSEVGEFNERFEIIFKEEAALSLDENNVEANTLRIVSLYGDAFLFKTSDHLSIKTVAIFDLLGRQLYDLKGTKSAETYSLSNLSKATYVVRVQLSNGAVITKKIIKN
ncbi:T9SS sorting signal type C domain-containing protein [Algibacter mikhailovii]|uniref:T9SS sorting signal type C domain-containing protein n=1 Tax=Algibacter mikhailovii TaxID=425498 RepID=UPI00249421A5|nr:T9SS sorting signal type C domain-containing protein [Algibacter mikhailovii]